MIFATGLLFCEKFMRFLLNFSNNGTLGFHQTIEQKKKKKRIEKNPNSQLKREVTVGIDERVSVA